MAALTYFVSTDYQKLNGVSVFIYLNINSYNLVTQPTVGENLITKGHTINVKIPNCFDDVILKCLIQGMCVPYMNTVPCIDQN